MYLIVYLIAFFSLIIGIVIFNRIFKILSLEYLFYSFMLFIILFFICSKIGYIIIDLDFNQSIYTFITSGYAFIGGYFSCFILSLLTSKLFKWRNILILYIPNMLLFYSILKISCYIKGCCSGIIPIQLIESVFNFIGYLYICYLVLKKKDINKIINMSIILFSILRIILSLFRSYTNIYSLIIVELICIINIISLRNKQIYF